VLESDDAAYGLIVRFEVLDGHQEDFDGLTAETVAAIRVSEPGTMVYMVHREVVWPGNRVFYELYRDEAAFEAHEAMPHIRRFLSERPQHLCRDPEVWRVTPVSGLVRPEADPGGG